MDIRQLKTFVEVCGHLNFTRTAEALGYAQSSITSQIQQLESELGFKLFERIGKSINLTPEAENALPIARQMIMLAEEMTFLRQKDDEPTGIIRLGAPESLSIYRLPKVLKIFREKYPRVEIQLQIINGEEAISALSNNSLDIAFTIGRKLQHDAIVACLEIVEPLVVLAPVGHPFANEKRLTGQSLVSQHLILTGTGCHYRKAFLDCLGTTQKPQISLETGSIQAIKQACISGLGICVLPKVAAMDELMAGQLVELDFDCGDVHMVSQLIHHKDKWMGRAVQSFVDLSIEMLR